MSMSRPVRTAGFVSLAPLVLGRLGLLLCARIGSLRPAPPDCCVCPTGG